MEIFRKHRCPFELMAAITGEDTRIVSCFRGRFPWDYFFQGAKQKTELIRRLQEREHLSAGKICYVGDGKYDVEPLASGCLGICPADAIDSAKRVCDMVLQKGGGQGCLWELIGILRDYNAPERPGLNAEALSVNTSSLTAGWIDSTSMLIISGQAKRADLIGSTGVRQIGSQEVQIIDMVRPITKYAVQIMEPNEIRYHLERACYEAMDGRPGPVWLSIPLDAQGAMVEKNELKGFAPEAKKPTDIREAVNRTLWKTIDMMGEDDPLYLGHPGAMGDRGANLILQSADLIISIGSRLDTSITAFNEPRFGMSAKKIVVEIDPHELRRMNLSQVEISLECGAGRYIRELYEALTRDHDFSEQQKSWREWLAGGKALRAKYPSVTEEHRKKTGYVSAYYFTELLCEYTTAEDVIVPESSGAAGEITYQAFLPKREQKMKNAPGLRISAAGSWRWNRIRTESKNAGGTMTPISRAAISCGAGSFPAFDAVSVRETSSVSAVQRFTDRKVAAVLDPTLLLSQEEYAPLEIGCEAAAAGFGRSWRNWSPGRNWRRFSARPIPGC